MTRRSLGVSVCFFVFACGGGPVTPATRPTSDSSVTGPLKPWESMSYEERQSWMMNQVYPRMSRMFQEQDHDRYAQFGCPTCHGPDPEARHYAMPSAALPALYPTGSPEQRQMVREYPQMVRFMFNGVLPTMQTMLGAEEYNPQTRQGFSCYACHPHAGDPGTTPIRLSTSEQPDGGLAAPDGEVPDGGV